MAAQKQVTEHKLSISEAGMPRAAAKKPWWSRTGIEPAGLLTKSGALPLSYGPVTKDGPTMPQGSLLIN
jgi:hypothetical protein